MRRPLVGLLGLAAASAIGCSIPLTSAGNDEQVNTCVVNADCADGSVCASRDGVKLCIATTVDLTGLALVVSPVAGSTTVAATPFILDPTGVTPLTRTGAAGYAEEFSAALPALAELSMDAASSCSATAGPNALLATTVVLTRVPTAAGLPPLSVTAVVDADNPLLRTSSLPPGHYTAYIQPDATLAPTDCLVPPPNVLDLDLASGPTSFHIGLDGYIELSGSIQNELSLAGWQLDAVDPDGGRPISSTAVLDETAAFSALRINWKDKLKSPILRLRPPTEQAAPTIYWQLASALGASSSYEVNLTLDGFDPTAKRHVEVVAVANANADPSLQAQVSALVTFQSVAIEGLEIPASFSTTVQSDATGSAAADLPPGRYVVSAVPTVNDGLGIGQISLDVPAATKNDDACFCGHTIPLPPKALLSGGVTTPALDPLVDVLVQAIPSQAQLVAFDSLLAGTALVPRPAAGQTGADGAFTLGIDAGGLLDLSVQPASSSNFPWLVVSQVQVQLADTGQLATSDLGELGLPAPALLSGYLRDPSGAPVTSATVRAFLPVSGALDPVGQPIVVQVGEATTDLDGRYRLLLPPTLSGSSPR